jgi:hypothetical protein
MLPGIINIMCGVLFIYGGMSGRLRLHGAEGETVLVGFGVFLVVLGMAVIIKKRSQSR